MRLFIRFHGCSQWIAPVTDSTFALQTTNLLLERLRAWKHMCGNLEDYVSVTAKVQKSQSKDYEKVLKVRSLVGYRC